MDEDPFRPPLGRSRVAQASPLLAGAGGPLIPLARAQDAVARLEAAVAAAPENVAAGLRARLALFEAAGYLAHCGTPLHPHDLTGSYAAAVLTGRLKEAAPWTTEEGGEAAPRRAGDRAAAGLRRAPGADAHPTRRRACC